MATSLSAPPVTHAKAAFAHVAVDAGSDSNAITETVALFVAEQDIPADAAAIVLGAASRWAPQLVRSSGGWLLVRVIGGPLRGAELIAMSALPVSFEDPGGDGHGFDTWSGPQGSVAVVSSDGLRSGACFGVAQHAFRDGLFCGDSWAVGAGDGTLAALLVDGIGHGPVAATASAAAVAAFQDEPWLDAVALASRVHANMGGTVGGVGAVAVWSQATSTLHFAALGDITGRLIDGPHAQGLASNPGIFGLRSPRLRAFAYSAARGLLVLHSDGVRPRWRLEDYPGLQHRHPALIAAMLHRDNARPGDDGTVLVVRLSQAVSLAATSQRPHG